MYSFFVLGQIPGTSITISFTQWLILCLLATAVFLVVRSRRQHQQGLILDPTITADDQAATAH